MLKWNDGFFFMAWANAFERERKKGKECNISSTTQTHSELNEATKKKTKKKSFSTETTERYQIIFRIHRAMHTIFLSTVCLFFCVFLFFTDVQNERREKRIPTTYCNHVFWIVFFSRLHAALYFFVVFSFCFNLKYTSREREKDWRIVFFVLFKRKISIKIYLARLLYSIQSLVAGILDRFFLQTFHFILVLLLRHLVSYCFPKATRVSVCVMCVKYVNNIQNKNKPKRWNLFWCRWKWTKPKWTKGCRLFNWP